MFLLHNMDEDGEAAAEREVVAEQNDEVVVEATEEENGKHKNPRYKTTNNSPTKRTWPWPMVTLYSMTRDLRCSLCCA